MRFIRACGLRDGNSSLFGDYIVDPVRSRDGFIANNIELWRSRGSILRINLFDVTGAVRTGSLSNSSLQGSWAQKPIDLTALRQSWAQNTIDLP